jgi:hypothetical protein
MTGTAKIPTRVLEERNGLPVLDPAALPVLNGEFARPQADRENGA